MASSPSSTPSIPGQASQKPLSGLSLYAGISFSSNGTDSSKSADPAVKDSATVSASRDTDTTATPSVATSAPSSSWSAALRFAPRKSSSTSSAAGLNRNRPRPAIVAPSFSSSESNPLRGDDDETTLEGSTDSLRVATPELKGRSLSSPSTVTVTPSTLDPTANAGGGRSSFASSSAVLSPQQPSSIPPAVSTAVTVPTLALATPALTPSKYLLPLVTRPPELRLSQAEIDADRAMARDAAIARGERGQPQHQQSYWAGGDDNDDGGWDEEEDINGFAMSGVGQKSKKKRSKRRRAHSPGRHQAAAMNWDADYDPRTPNDFSAWKEVVRTRRQSFKRIEAQKRRNEQGDTMYNEDDGDSGAAEEDDEVDEERLRKYRKWAPPPSYAVNTSSNQRIAALNNHDDEGEEEEKLYISPPPENLPAAILAAGPQVPPYPQRQPLPAFVQAAQASTPTLLPLESSGLPSVPAAGKPLTGEEAYQRRLAMSQQRSQPSSSTASVSLPPPSGGDALAERRGVGEAVPALVSGAPPAMDLAARQAAAAAIAARLASIAPPPPPPPGPPPGLLPGQVAGNNTTAVSPEECGEHQGDFATRLMSKWGHQTGQGLGAEGNQGMTEALVMGKVSSKGVHRKETAALASTSRGGGSIRGKYTTIDPRKQVDREKYGDPSEVILLHGLLPPPASVSSASVSGSSPALLAKGEGDEVEQVDESLPEEIAEECSKYGYVQRVAIFPRILAPATSFALNNADTNANANANADAPSPQVAGSTRTETGQATRSGGVVFVVFTGQVGAYKAVRELDGRFFSGRVVRARYFDKKVFEGGEESWRTEVQEWLAGVPIGNGKQEG